MSPYLNTADMSRADSESQANQALVNGVPETFLNLMTARMAARPKNIMIDSMRMNLDWVSIAVSEKEFIYFSNKKTKYFWICFA